MTRKQPSPSLAPIVSVLVLALAAPALALPPQELGLDEVLARHFEVQGGAETMSSVESMVITGTMSMSGMQMPFRRLAMRPNKTRVDFTIQGLTGIQAYDGETAWMHMPFMGMSKPEPMPADLAQSMAEDAVFDGHLIDWEAKGNVVELVGMADVEGTPAYELTVTLPSGNVQHQFIDAEYFVLLKVEGTQTMNGQPMPFVNMFGDFKDIQGFLMPHSMELHSQGQVQALTIESVEINATIDASEFTMPQDES